MSQASTEIVRISGHAGSVPGAGLNREFTVCKLVDTTTCIGCKACEVACLEWNGYTFTETTFDNTYQTMPETAWNCRLSGSQLHRLRLLHHGLSLQHPKVQSQGAKGLQMHTL